MKHTLDICVYYEDTDAGGVVYHSNYLNFAERGRTELLKDMGYQNSTLKSQNNILFLVRHIEIKYFKPALLDDVLRVQTHILELKNTSLTMSQEILRGQDRLSYMKVALVCVDSDTIKPTRLPADIKADFEKYIL